MSRSDVRVGAFLLVVGLLGLPTARADILVKGTKYIEPHAILLADRFDDYCEHRVTVRAGDTLEAIARSAYDDPARAGEIAKANPGVVATNLQIGSTLVLPARKTPPADAKEELAWQFFAWSRLSGTTQPERVFPGERFEAPGKVPVLVAFPAARAADFEQLRKQRIQVLDRKSLAALAPWVHQCDGFGLLHTISDRSRAVESTTTFRIEELGRDARGEPVFRVKSDGTTYVDQSGKVVEAGMLGLLTDSPLVLIPLAGAAGLFVLFRRRRAARIG